DALCPSLPRAALRSTWFPYTTLFRSGAGQNNRLPKRHTMNDDVEETPDHCAHEGHERNYDPLRDSKNEICRGQDHLERHCSAARSEEHTSELQSPAQLVCRLLLEKKQ